MSYHPRNGQGGRLRPGDLQSPRLARCCLRYTLALMPLRCADTGTAFGRRGGLPLTAAALSRYNAGAMRARADDAARRGQGE